MREDSNVSI